MKAACYRYYVTDITLWIYSLHEMNKVEEFCGKCAVPTVAKDKRRKEGDHFNLIFLVGEKKRKKISIVIHD